MATSPSLHSMSFSICRIRWFFIHGIMQRQLHLATGYICYAYHFKAQIIYYLPFPFVVCHLSI
jgi:hypothetical protein